MHHISWHIGSTITTQAHHISYVHVKPPRRLYANAWLRSQPKVAEPFAGTTCNDPNPIGLEALVLQIFETKHIEFSLKLDHTQAYSLTR